MIKSKSTFDFSEKKILVTGGARGIGRAIVEAFLDAGALVAVNGRSEASVSSALKHFAAGDRAKPAVGNVANVEECNRIVNAAVDQLGGLDVLVNNAGVFYIGSVAETNEDLWDSMFDINVKGTFYCCQAAQPVLEKSEGAIVNIASQAGLEGYTNIAAYCASKAAVVNMTRAMSLEFAPDIRVNCICPGFIDTDMTRTALTSDEKESADLSEVKNSYPLKRIGTPEEVASLVLYVSSSDASFITGTAIAIDGGGTAGH